MKEDATIFRIGALEVPVRRRAVRRALMAGVFVGQFIRTAGMIRSRLEQRFGYAVTLESDDPTYALLHRELQAAAGGRSRRHRVVTGTNVVDEVVGNREAVVHRVMSRSTSFTVLLEGHRLHVEVGLVREDSTDDQIVGGLRDMLANALRSSAKVIEQTTITAYTAAGHAAVLALVDRLAVEAVAKPKSPRLFLPRWETWNAKEEVHPRTLDSVVLGGDVKDKITADLESFLGSEADYVKVGVPWRRGYLLSGPAGTGKTSLVRALASEYGMDLYYLPLRDLYNDTSLLNIVAQIPTRAMLLFEDIDVYHKQTARQADEGGTGPTLSGLLNALDGVGSPHGLVVFMTTNKGKGKWLDAALGRPGRIDRRFQLGHLTDDQLARLVALCDPALAGVTWPPLGDTKVAPAQVTSMLMQMSAQPTDIKRKIIEGMLT